MIEPGSYNSSTDTFISKYLPSSPAEMVRSLSLSFAITSLLFWTAILILVVSTDDPLEVTLNVSVEEFPELAQIPEAFRLIYFLCALVQILVAICGIYGLGGYKRHSLAFYGYAHILMLIWCVYVLVHIHFRDDEDHAKIKLFKEYKTNHRAQHLVRAIQIQSKCCGSKYHSPTDSRIYKTYNRYPNSCCKKEMEENCTATYAFKKQCRTQRASIIKYLNDVDGVEYAYAIMGIFCGGLMIQAFFVFYTIRKINLQRYWILEDPRML